MGPIKEPLRQHALGGALTEVPDLGFESLPLELTFELAPVDVVVVRRWLEEVIGKRGPLAPLQVAEDQIDPLVQGAAHVVALESQPVLNYEVLVRLSPLGQADILDLLLEVVEAELHLVEVAHELSIPEVELRYELLVVCEHLEAAAVPGHADVVKDAVGWTPVSLVLHS